MMGSHYKFTGIVRYDTKLYLSSETLYLEVTKIETT